MQLEFRYELMSAQLCFFLRRHTCHDEHRKHQKMREIKQLLLFKLTCHSME